MPRSKKAENRSKSDTDSTSYKGGEDFFEYCHDHAGQVAGRKRRNQVRRRSQHRLHSDYQENGYHKSQETRAY